MESFAASTRSPSMAAAVAAPLNRKTILVVDDRAINRNFLVSLLKHFDYKLLEAESAEEAWGIAVTGNIDLIITDVFMAGIDGLKLLEKLQEDPRSCQIPAIIYTAEHKHVELERLKRGKQLSAVLTKPSEPEMIIEAVQRALGAEPGTLGQRAQASSSARTSGTAALIEFMQDLAEHRDLDTLMEAFCRASRALLQAAESVAYLLPYRGMTCSRTYSSDRLNGDLELLDESRISGAVSRIIHQHAVGRFSHTNPREYGIPLGSGTMACWMCIPIATATQGYGCVCVLGKPGCKEFDDEDERLATTLAGHVAVLYENGIFFEEVQGLAARLAREVEERKRTEEELERSRKEQNRLKDEFLSHVSHELRSPVMAAEQFLEILREELAGPVNDEQREYLDIALRNTHQLRNMIGDLLDTTRIETGKLRVDTSAISLEHVLKESVNSLKPAAQQKRLSLTLDVANELPLVIADRARVRQITTNLLENAIKFTYENGTVEIKAFIDAKSPTFVRIEVADTGCGLQPEEVSRVFDRHYQAPSSPCAARTGLGLGLCICKELVTLQGGEIDVRSHSGDGSVFSFSLPVFSVGNLLRPLFSDRINGDAVIVPVEIEVPPNEPLELVSRLRDTLQRCALPDLDVVIPQAYPTENGRMFLIVAQTDQRGAQVMIRRIANQLKNNPDLADIHCSFTDYPILNLWGGSPAQGVEEQIARAIGRVDDTIHSILRKRNPHARQENPVG